MTNRLCNPLSICSNTKRCGDCGAKVCQCVQNGAGLQPKKNPVKEIQSFILQEESKTPDKD